jgi:hypothetical protein
LRPQEKRQEKGDGNEDSMPSQSKETMLEMSTNKERQRELLRSQNSGVIARNNMLLSKRAPPILPFAIIAILLRRRPKTAIAATPATTTLTRTEGFVSLAAPLGWYSPRCLRRLQRSKRRSRRDGADSKAKNNHNQQKIRFNV